MRVVSLLPAATEIVAALGAAGRLVGISHECDYPPEVRTLPRVTRTALDPALPSGAIDRAMAAAQRSGVSPVQLDLGFLRRLAPDLIIGQSLCDVCAIGATELERAVAALGRRPSVVTLHAHDLAGVFADMQRVGEALDLADEADELVAAAGGEDVANRPGARSAARSWRELAALAPDVVVIACCGFDVARAQGEYESVTDRDARALFAGRVEFLDGNAYTSRPGPRLIEAAEWLAALMRR